MVKNIRNKKAATLVETIMIILVIAIVGATVAGGVVFFVQLFIYSPRQLDVQKVGERLNNIMIEGDQDIRGIRYTRNVIDASDIQFSYTYGYPTSDDQLSVRFRWDGTVKHIYQSTSTDQGSSWSTEAVIPYHMPSSITIDGKDTPSVIFTYKKANDAAWVSGSDDLVDIRRLILSINAKSGAGNFADFQGTTDITSSIEIKNFQ